jgi:hypothetical protein
LHADVKWRHFGYYQKKLYLFDLGIVSEVTKGDSEVKTWIKASLEGLRSSMGTAEAGIADAGTVDAAGSPARAAASRPSKRIRYGH